MECWHRPGRTLRSGSVVCRFCGVVIEWCPCVAPYYWAVDHECPACRGSMWVSVVRSSRAKFEEYLSRVA